MKLKLLSVVCACLVVVTVGAALGSAYLPIGEIIYIIGNKLFGIALPDSVAPTSVSILWNLRLPRTLLAFIAGGALSVSGAVMQSVLRNPLASSYTLGVSSGASLGAGLVIFFGFSLPLITAFTLPLMGFLFGIATIVIAVSFAARIDGRLESNTIILTGMVFSLFINAVTTLLSALERNHMQRLIYWQMGSFSMKGWEAVYVLAPMALLITLFIMRYHRELDIMTFGEEQAKAIGVNMKSTKWILLISSAALTGGAIAFSGVIGFVDLVAPHIVRRLFGASHRFVIPMSALFGGMFMVVCDLVARTVVSPEELPVGAVTALIGAPFFGYIYFSRRNRK